MTSIAKSTAFVASFAISVAVAASGVQAGSERCPAIALVNVNGEQVALPAETAAQVTMLQQYGARYARVIGLILEENAKPEWTFADACTPQGAGLQAMTE